MRDSAAPSSRQLVTSSDLVRHFGYWQDRAARAPVYVLHRGRPRLVLTSVEIMDALCAPHATGQAGCSPDLAAVFERITEHVLVADDGQRIVAASASAERAFGALVDPGAALAGIVADSSRAQLTATIDRVLHTGVAAALDLPARLHPERLLTLVIDSWPGGLLLIASNTTKRRAESDALDAAIAASGAAAAALIDRRGFLENPSLALARLSEQPLEALAGTGFASLFDSASQDAVRAALDRVLVTGSPLQINALLLAKPSTARSLRIGLAPRHAGDVVIGVAALLVTPG